MSFSANYIFSSLSMCTQCTTGVASAHRELRPNLTKLEYANIGTQKGGPLLLPECRPQTKPIIDNRMGLFRWLLACFVI